MSEKNANNDSSTNILILVWKTPSKLIELLATDDFKVQTLVLLYVFCCLNSLDVVTNFDLAQRFELWQILLIVLTWGAALSLLVFLLFTKIIFLVGKRLGGGATLMQLRKVLLWSQAPTVTTSILLWGPLIFSHRKEVFDLSFWQALQQADTASQATAGFAGTILLLLMLIYVIGMLWSLVLALRLHSQIQSFTLSRSFTTLLLSMLLLAVVMQLLLKLF